MGGTASTGIHGNTREHPDPGYPDPAEAGSGVRSGSGLSNTTWFEHPGAAGRQERSFLLLCSRNDGSGGTLVPWGYEGSASNKASLSYYWRSNSYLYALVHMAPPVIRYPYLITGGALLYL